MSAPTVTHEVTPIRERGFGILVRVCLCGQFFHDDEAAEAHVEGEGAS